MVERTKTTASVKSECDAIIAYLAQGVVQISVTSQDGVQLSKMGSANLKISIAALAHLAKTNRVKRDGRFLRLIQTATANAQPVTKNQDENQKGGNSLGANKAASTPEQLSAVSRVIESPIDYLAARKDKNGVALLGQDEWAAGYRLRSDFTRANMLPGISMRWGEYIGKTSGAGGNSDQTNATLAARERVTKALNAVGPEFSGLLTDVCCFLQGLEQVELERGWPKRSAKLMLRAGLSILVRHYTPRSHSTVKVRSWSDKEPRAGW